MLKSIYLSVALQNKPVCEVSELTRLWPKRTYLCAALKKYLSVVLKNILLCCVRELSMPLKNIPVCDIRQHTCLCR